MTTYLETYEAAGPPAQDITHAYCSTLCRATHIGPVVRNRREDDRYEFDETCANCGVLIPAS